MTDNILELANSAVGGERGDDYGHPLDDFTRSAEMISGLLGYPVKPSDIPLIMICIKLSRQKNQYKADNLVDIAGYALTAEMVHEEAMKRDQCMSTFNSLKDDEFIPSVNNFNTSYTGPLPVLDGKIDIGWYIAMDKDDCWWRYESKPDLGVASWGCTMGYSGKLINKIKPWHDWIDSLFQMTETGLVKV